MSGTEIELNADMGEGLGVWPSPMQVWRFDLDRGGSIDPDVGEELPALERILRMVSTVNLACGFHAGDPFLIKRYVAAAKAAGCTIGAHPSYPDLAGFGLRYMDLTPGEIIATVQYQLGALDGFLRMEGMTLHHVKCHGALYNRAVKDEVVAKALAEAVAAYRSDLPLYGFPKSCMEDAAKAAGIPFVREAFADRAYHTDGSLVDRRRADSMILKAEAVAERVVEMAKSGTVATVDGGPISLMPKTICFHADTPDVMGFLAKSLAALEASNIHITGRTRRPN
jgi:5-oxoprolinase (ATP-hydrolysing) subunit A